MAKTPLKMNYSIDKSSKFIVCNFPEKIPTDAYPENGYCLNKVRTESAGKGQIFYSYNCYDDYFKSGSYFGIQVYNRSDKTITFTREYYGHADTKTDPSWANLPKNSWTKFFQSSSKSFSIGAYKSVWICDEALTKNTLFSGNLRYNTTGKVTITAFVYTDKSRITGSEVPYPYKNDPEINVNKLDRIYRQYSGDGDGYFYMADRLTIKTSELQGGNSVFFQTNFKDNTEYNINGIKGSKENHEIIPIRIAGTGHTAKVGEAEPLHNVANWSVQYSIPITFVNNTGSTATIKYTLEKPNLSEGEINPIIYNNGSVLSRQLTPSNRSWQCKTFSVRSGASVNFDYQFILGTNSVERVDHVFSL